MSKVVTIPKDRNPFVVIVNGVKYSYPAGVTTEVPDEVADVIEKYVGAKPKPDPNAGINFGGTQSDWNQTDSSAADFIKNKPFGDMPTGGDTLYWDGNTEGLETLDLGMGVLFYKLSDAAPSLEELNTGTLQYSHGIEQAIDAAPIADTVFLAGELALICTADTSAEGITVPKGVFFTLAEGVHVSSLTIPGYTGFPVTKKIEEKYLPGAVILYADAEAEGYLYATSDTSDTSKRLTKAELLKVLQSGNAVYLHHLDFVYCLAVTFIDLGDSMGVGFAISGEYVNAYTAEYVPEG